MALWKRLWLLFSVIWGVVASLNVLTILLTAEEPERGKALMPLFFGFAVPACLYLAGWLWERWRARR